MYNPEAQYQGMQNVAAGVRDFFFGSTYELGTSVYSEFWGDPNDPNRVTPISQRGWGEISLLVGGAALECSPAKFLGPGFRGVKYLGKGALKVPYVKKAASPVIRNVSKQNTISAKIISIQNKFFGHAPKNEQKILSLKNDLNEWLGKGTKMIKNEANDPIFLSKDALRRARFDFNRPYPHENPHGHIEFIQNGRWEKSGQIYPKDVPKR